MLQFVVLFPRVGISGLAAFCDGIFGILVTHFGVSCYYLVWIWREEVGSSYARMISAANAGFHALHL